MATEESEQSADVKCELGVANLTEKDQNVPTANIEITDVEVKSGQNVEPNVDITSEVKEKSDKTEDISGTEVKSTGDESTDPGGDKKDGQQSIKMEEGEGTQKAETSEAGPSGTIDPYAYLNRNEFTTEIYKIEIYNLPFRFGIGVSKATV